MSEYNQTGTENWSTTVCPSTKEITTVQIHTLLFKILLPLVVLAALISTLIYYAIKKRRLDELRHRLVPFYKFEPGDGEDEWQTEWFDDSHSRRSFTRLQDYRSTGSISSEYYQQKSIF